MRHKNKECEWSKDQNEAFCKSKALLTTENVLIHYKTNVHLTLACDASMYGVGAVLSHQFKDGSEKPIAFASRTLSKAEQHYSQIEKESLACIFGVKRFHSYISQHCYHY